MAAAGGMAAAASVAASGLSALAASAGALADRCGSAGGNIISGPLSAGAGPGPGSNGGAGGVGVGVGGVAGVSGGSISLGSGAGTALHLGGSTGSLKQECDSLMHASNASGMGGMSGYVPPMYHRPMSFNEPLRKRALRSPYAEQELRGSVLRDGSKNSSECPSPINKPTYHRPSSSASSTAPTEADTMHSERASPQSRQVSKIQTSQTVSIICFLFFSRYENHSPSTTAGNGNAPSSLDRIVKSERNNGSANEANDDERELMDESTDV